MSYFEYFAIEDRPKMAWRLRCENVKLFLGESLVTIQSRIYTDLSASGGLTQIGLNTKKSQNINNFRPLYNPSIVIASEAKQRNFSITSGNVRNYSRRGGFTPMAFT